MCFSAAASSENDHGSMTLASNTAPVSLTSPSSVAAIQGMVLWTAWRWISAIRWPEFCSYQRRLRSSVANPSWTIRTPERSMGAASPRFSRQRRWRAFSSWPMMIRASEPPMNWLRSRGTTGFGPILGIAPLFTDLVLLVIVAPEVGLADYIINVMLHQMSVNIKNVRLHKKCRLAQRSAVVLVAYLVGPNRIFQGQAK